MTTDARLWNTNDIAAPADAFSISVAVLIIVQLTVGIASTNFTARAIRMLGIGGQVRAHSIKIAPLACVSGAARVTANVDERVAYLFGCQAANLTLVIAVVRVVADPPSLAEALRHIGTLVVGRNDALSTSGDGSTGVAARVSLAILPGLAVRYRIHTFDASPIARAWDVTRTISRVETLYTHAGSGADVLACTAIARCSLATRNRLDLIRSVANVLEAVVRVWVGRLGNDGSRLARSTETLPRETSGVGRAMRFV
jgi:hypothetical protein